MTRLAEFIVHKYSERWGFRSWMKALGVRGEISERLAEKGIRLVVANGKSFQNNGKTLFRPAKI